MAQTQKFPLVESLGKSISDMLVGHLDSPCTLGQPWPDDAEYCVEYRVKAWPCDYVRNTQFFTDAFALTRWVDSQVAWARYEDNYFELDGLYMWDLEPERITDIHSHINAR